MILPLLSEKYQPAVSTLAPWQAVLDADMAARQSSHDDVI